LRRRSAPDAADARRAARDHLADQRDTYPTLAAQGHLDDRDWDAVFTRGLDYLIAGILAA